MFVCFSCFFLVSLLQFLDHGVSYRFLFFTGKYDWLDILFFTCVCMLTSAEVLLVCLPLFSPKSSMVEFRKCYVCGVLFKRDVACRSVASSFIKVWVSRQGTQRGD